MKMNADRGRGRRSDVLQRNGDWGLEGEESCVAGGKDARQQSTVLEGTGRSHAHPEQPVGS